MSGTEAGSFDFTSRSYCDYQQLQNKTSNYLFFSEKDYLLGQNTNKDEIINSLTKIKRFGTVDNIIHRNDILSHSVRVNNISWDLSWFLLSSGIKVDLNRVMACATFHDYLEIFTGDIPYNIKKDMSETEKTNLKNRETEFISDLYKKYFNNQKINIGEFYSIFDDIDNRHSIEAQIVKIADFIDVTTEICNELFCGNKNLKYSNYKNKNTPANVYDNLEVIKKTIEKFPIFKSISQYEFLDLNNLPPIEKINSLPTINCKDELENFDSFCKIMAWPQIFQYGLYATLSTTDYPEQLGFCGWYGSYYNTIKNKQTLSYSNPKNKDSVYSYCGKKPLEIFVQNYIKIKKQSKIC